MSLTRTHLLETDIGFRSAERTFRSTPTKINKRAWVRSLHQTGRFHGDLRELQTQFREALTQRDNHKRQHRRWKHLADRAARAHSDHPLVKDMMKHALSGKGAQNFDAKAHPDWKDFQKVNARSGHLHQKLEDAKKRLDDSKSHVARTRSAAHRLARRRGISSSGKHLAPLKGESIKDHLSVLAQYNHALPHYHQHDEDDGGRVDFPHAIYARRFAGDAKRHWPGHHFRHREHGGYYEPGEYEPPTQSVFYGRSGLRTRESRR
jgi:hypothetical protein